MKSTTKLIDLIASSEKRNTFGSNQTKHSMKRLFTLCTLFFFSFPVFCQTTTVEEYNFLTKGYRIQIESGLDMKKGYQLLDLSTTTTGAYKFYFKELVRTQTNEVAAVLLIATSDVSGLTYYYAIPRNNNDLLGKFYNEIGLLDESMTTALAVATARALSIKI